jgi:hypothetical protein
MAPVQRQKDHHAQDDDDVVDIPGVNTHPLRGDGCQNGLSGRVALQFPVDDLFAVAVECLGRLA